MRVRESLERVLDQIPEERAREVLDFAHYLASQEEAQQWREAARDRFARAYANDEPEYTADMVRPELDP